MAKKETKQNFNGAADILPGTAFAASLQEMFGCSETARRVLGVFRQLDIPAPETSKEYMHGSHGRIIFLNDYGLVMRIEKNSESGCDRVNDSPWVLAPLATLKAGKAIIEIIPAVDFEPDERNSNALCDRLLQEGTKFWDFGARNVGRVPVKTPQFPEGIPVVIDRPSVTRLSAECEAVRQALLRADKDDAEKYQEAVKAQEKLYAPLRRIFSECWPETQKMKKFWDECRRYVREKKLVAGWNDPASSDVLNEQATYAYNVAKNYGARFQGGVKI